MSAVIRRAALLAALSLLTSAVAAHAECAWILWMELPVGSAQWTLGKTPSAAFEKRADCERMAQGAAAVRAAMADEAAKRGEKVENAFFVCLPDTVDPRAPKGR